MWWDEVGHWSTLVAIGLMILIAGYLLGRRAGFKEGYRQVEIDFDEEVQETAQAKINRILHDANRTTLPRHDTTGPAKIHHGTPGRKPKHKRKS